jgi:hypothetical protein
LVHYIQIWSYAAQSTYHQWTWIERRFKSLCWYFYNFCVVSLKFQI